MVCVLFLVGIVLVLSGIAASVVMREVSTYRECVRRGMFCD